MPLVYSPQTDVHKYVFSSKVEFDKCQALLMFTFPTHPQVDFYFGVNHIHADNLVVTTMALNFAIFSSHDFIHDVVLWCKFYARHDICH